ncbi:MAG: hypothetical protein J6N18_02905, partial [Kiritimatiellae bacterium]|nr:hypothetical protein [Kiritimatiellia bacterium]
NKTVYEDKRIVDNKVRTYSHGDAEGGEAPETVENRADIGSRVGLKCIENMVRTDSQGVGMVERMVARMVAGMA